MSKRQISPILHLFLGCAMYQWTVSQQSLCQESKDHPGRYLKEDRDVVCSCDIQGRKHDFLWVTCFNEQAKLLLNDNHPSCCVLCKTVPCCPFPKRKPFVSQLATGNCIFGSERSMKLKKKGRFVNFVEYV
jgi:hypothetical protein